MLGKIELPKEKVKTKTPPKKTATEDPNKRKRKRIKKVNVEKAGKKAIQEHRTTKRIKK